MSPNKDETRRVVRWTDHIPNSQTHYTPYSLKMMNLVISSFYYYQQIAANSHRKPEIIESLGELSEDHNNEKQISIAEANKSSDHF